MATASDKTEVREQTPISVIANVSRVVTSVVERITGDRADFPLLVAAAAVQALKNHGVESRIMYGDAAWIEVLEDQSLIWAGCWSGNVHFWVATQYGEVVDLNTSVAHRKRAHSTPTVKALYSPPMLWSKETPAFYRFVPEGVAELELTEERDRQRFELVVREIHEKCTPEALASGEQDFPNEPIICPGRKLLDDSKESFRHFDRALAVRGIPEAPF